MKVFYATGRNGSIIQVEDGRNRFWADTVTGECDVGTKPFMRLDHLLDISEDAEAVTKPLFSDFTIREIKDHVGS